MNLFSISGDDLPEPIRRVLEQASDPSARHMRHQVMHLQERDFFESLSEAQAVFLGKVFDGLSSLEPIDVIRQSALHSGQLDMLLSLKFGRYGCGQGLPQVPDSPGDLEGLDEGPEV